jgi:hypothetical protein
VDSDVRERLATNKRATHIFHMKIFKPKKLNDVEIKEQYLV